jgi:hypothetical protein
VNSGGKSGADQHKEVELAAMSREERAKATGLDLIGNNMQVQSMAFYAVSREETRFAKPLLL